MLLFGKVIHLTDLAKAHGTQVGTHACKLEVATIDKGGFITLCFNGVTGEGRLAAF